jgi:hypothetical protein
VETDLFEHREVKPHFINPCCFWEDFAKWLRQELADITALGFELSEPIQEDWRRHCLTRVASPAVAGARRRRPAGPTLTMTAEDRAALSGSVSGLEDPGCNELPYAGLIYKSPRYC